MGIDRSAIVLEVEPRLGWIKVVGLVGAREPAAAGALALILQRVGVEDGCLPWERLGERAFGLKRTWVVNDAEGRALKVDGRAVKVRLRDESLSRLMDRCWRRGITRRFVSGTLRVTVWQDRSQRSVQWCMAILGGLFGAWMLVSAVVFTCGFGTGGWFPRSPSTLSLIDRLIYAAILTLPSAGISLTIMVLGVRQLRADARSVRLDAHGLKILEGARAPASIEWAAIERIEKRLVDWAIFLHGGERVAVLNASAFRPVLEHVRNRVDPEHKVRKRRQNKRALRRSSVMFAAGAVVAWMAGYWWLPPVAAPTAIGQAWMFAGTFVGMGAAYAALGAAQLRLQLGAERRNAASGRRRRRRVRKDALATGQV